MLRMISIRSWLLTTLLAAVVTLTSLPDAKAQDLSGPYNPFPFVNSYPSSNWAALYAGAHLGAAISDKDGFTGRATLGYNIQSNQLVWGVETDPSGTDISGPLAVDWLWTLPARLGMAMSGNILPYITGGLAVGDVNATAGGFSASETNTGWTIGGGLEVKLGSNWSLKG